MSKKDFTEKSNPAMGFFSPETIAAVDAQSEGSGGKLRPKKEKPEAKTQRVQLLIKPSIHAALKAEAKATGDSVNGIINIAIEEYLEGNK